MVARGLLGSLLFLAAAADAWAVPPTPQDFQVISRAMSFTGRPPRASMTVAIVYDSANPASAAEARAAATLLANGMRVGDTVLRGVELDQRRLGSAGSYDAIFSVAGVDQVVLARLLAASGTPCFTLDTRQVSDGACTVAVRTTPAVSISMNSQNASAAGVRFATAFIMMVREL